MTNPGITDPMTHQKQDSTIDLEMLNSAMRVQRHMNLIKLFMMEVKNLPWYRDNEREQWALFEKELRAAWEKTTLDGFPLTLQKHALLGCLEGESSKVHALITEGWWGWILGTTKKLFLDQMRSVLSSPEKVIRNRLTFKQVVQWPREPIMTYYARKWKAFHGAVEKINAGTLEYFRSHVIRGIYSERVREKVAGAPSRT